MPPRGEPAVLEREDTAVDWRLMSEQPDQAPDARTQFEEQALPFMDQLYGACSSNSGRSSPSDTVFSSADSASGSRASAWSKATAPSR